jgi:hypothetical protein
MLVEKEIQKMFQDLVTKDRAQIFLSGLDVTVHVFDNSTKISLTTPVYFGSNYIPKSVRYGVTKSPPFDKNQTIKTTLTVDEKSFRVFLNYIGTTEILNNTKFTHLLEDFCYLAEEWRIYLDEHDKNDLVYVYAK